jgi:hypothetical protein
MCHVGIETVPGRLDHEEARVLTAERDFGNIERIKLTIRATYKLFELPNRPDFGQHGWKQAQLLLKERSRLMHPKNLRDLEVSDAEWEIIYEGATWVFSSLLRFMAQVAEVHGNSRLSRP